MTNALAVSINDAAALLGRNRATIYRMIKRGELRPVRYGGRQSIPVQQIYALTDTSLPIKPVPLALVMLCDRTHCTVADVAFETSLQGGAGVGPRS